MSVLLRLILGFLVGALSVLIFREPAVLALGQLGLTSGEVYQLARTDWGVPLIALQCAVGGAWGVLFVLLWDRMSFQSRGQLPTVVFAALAGLLVGGALHAGFGDWRAYAGGAAAGLLVMAFMALVGADALFGILFGLIGPPVVAWVVLPAIQAQPLFEGGLVSRMAVTAALGAAFGLGMAVMMSLAGRVSGRLW